MSTLFEGIGAAPGRALGPARRILGDLPRVPHVTVDPDQVSVEVARFEEARTWARTHVESLRRETAERIGEVEGKIFESQALMIEDPDLVERTLTYIRDNHVSAARAFELAMMEVRVRLLDAGQALAIDRLSDIQDIRLKILAHLTGRRETTMWDLGHIEPGILVAGDMTASQAARLDPTRAIGIVMSRGSIGSHAVILARALGIPVIVGLGQELERVQDGEPILMDGSRGSIVLSPDAEDVERFERDREKSRLRREQIREVARRPAETTDGIHITIQANLDQPDEAATAAELGAEGVGLFRSEFLAIGRREIPSEDEQYAAYRVVVEAFPNHEVTLRTFDVGGDKFPSFLSMQPEDNPYLGWRAIRVCLDLPDLFGAQLAAAVRASQHGKLRILLPMIATVDEVRRTRGILEAVQQRLGPEFEKLAVELGAMIETPAAVETIDLLAPYVDFISLGTNDLTQYVIAADRGNSRLARLYDALHPALVRMYARLARESERHGLDLSACGELAGDPAGICLLIGLGFRKLSVSIAALPEAEVLIRTVSASDLAQVCEPLADLESGTAVRAALEEYLQGVGAIEEPLTGGLSAD